jgi:hypothetical protein
LAALQHGCILQANKILQAALVLREVPRLQLGGRMQLPAPRANAVVKGIQVPAVVEARAAGHRATAAEPRVAALRRARPPTASDAPVWGTAAQRARRRARQGATARVAKG